MNKNAPTWLIILLIVLCGLIIPDVFREFLNYFYMIVSVCIFLSIKDRLTTFLNTHNNNNSQTYRRRAALRIASIYLAPYKNIWRNLKLSNKYCRLELGSDGVTITGIEKRSPYRTFRVLQSHVHEYTDLWDMFCRNFGYNKTFDGLLEDCKLYKVSIECKGQAPKPETLQEPQKVVYDKLDINNCSEIELTELPGISIVMAKKVVKKRDEIGGFKTIEDFFSFLKLKSHMQTQLRDRICLNKMKNARKKIERNSERKVDL